MNFGQAIASGFTNYASMKGRASRSAFWYWVLFTFIVELPGVILASLNLSEKNGLTLMVVGVIYCGIVALALLIPNITIQVRRLHDINFSGGWWWFHLLGGIGSIILLVLNLMPSVDEGNRFNR